MQYDDLSAGEAPDVEISSRFEWVLQFMSMATVRRGIAARPRRRRCHLSGGGRHCGARAPFTGRVPRPAPLPAAPDRGDEPVRPLLGRIQAVGTRSNGCQGPRVWTVFEIPSTPSLGICAGAPPLLGSSARQSKVAFQALLDGSQCATPRYLP